MKKITLITMMLTLLSVITFAQKGVPSFPWQGTVNTPSSTTFKTLPRQSMPRVGSSRRAAGELVTPPSTAATETWYTVDGFIAVNTPSGQQQGTPNIKVAIDGNDIYLQGIAFWFPEGWIKGTIDGTTATFSTGQYVGEDEQGPEYIIGVDNSLETITDIVFDYNAEEGILKAVTPYILECPSSTEINPYCWWVSPTFSKTYNGPKPVVAPEGLETTEWAINATTNFDDPVSGYVNIGFDGTDVYLQGLCTYLPETWIKGSLEGNTITFPGYQYFGPYDADFYTHYEFYLREDPVVFTYDAEAGTMTATGEVYIREAVRQYKGDVYNDPVIKKVTERVATPAIPNISQIYDGTLCPMVKFSVSTVDVDGNAMASSKLSFQFFKDVEQDITPITFDPSDYEVLTEAMSVFPYNYSNGDDFDPKYMNLKQTDYKTWNKIGIQSIYTGGGEERKSEIFWFTIKEYEKATFDFNAMTEEPCSSNDSQEGDITADRTLKAGMVTLTVSPSNGATANRFWATNNGPQLRVYGGTLTFEVPVGKVISKIVFNNTKWDAKNSADTGSFDGNVWTGNAKKVVVTIAGNTRLDNIVVFPADYEPTAVVAPEGLTTNVYVFNATVLRPYYEPAALTLWLNVGFDGDDAYIQGLASDYDNSASSLWVKATKNEEGKYVIPANQFMGALSFWTSTINYFFTAVDDKGNMVDAVLDYDAAKGQFSSTQTLVLNGSLKEVSAYEAFTDVIFTKFNEVAATPANPMFNSISFDEWNHNISFVVPTVDANDVMLNPNKLFYTIWIDKDNKQTPYVFTKDLYYTEEDVTEQPFNNYYSTWDASHNIYFADDAEELSSWKKVGVQSIYYGGGARNTSAIDWIENPLYTGISPVIANQKSNNVVIFNLKGQRLNAPQKGLNIINGKKVLVK